MLTQAHIRAHAFIRIYALAGPEVWCAHAPRADTDRAPLRLPLYARQVSSYALSLSLCQRILLLDWTAGPPLCACGAWPCREWEAGSRTDLIPLLCNARPGGAAQPAHSPATLCMWARSRRRPGRTRCVRSPRPAAAAASTARQPCGASRRALRAMCRFSCCSRHQGWRDVCCLAFATAGAAPA